MINSNKNDDNYNDDKSKNDYDNDKTDNNNDKTCLLRALSQNHSALYKRINKR